MKNFDNKKKIALFIPCYIDLLYPNVAIASLELLEKLGLTVDYPEQQTCCGQPMYNTGCSNDAITVAKKLCNLFKNYDYIICPSGSCTSMIKNHYKEFLPESNELKKTSNSIYELSEFLCDILELKKIKSSFPYITGIHQSCHGLRELNLAKSSERVLNPFSKTEKLLSMVEGIKIVYPQKIDECCGFGGTFAVTQEAVSCSMGNDRLDEHQKLGAEYITANDMSCLMHLEGLIKKQKRKIKVIHLAEILNSNI